MSPHWEPRINETPPRVYTEAWGRSQRRCACRSYCIIPRNRTSGEHTALTPSALSRQQFVFAMGRSIATTGTSVNRVWCPSETRLLQTLYQVAEFRLNGAT